jgi:polyisoprenoid-binding protein YceI
MNKILSLVITMLLAGNLSAQQTWSIDNAHSQVMFTVSHLVISEVTGNFKSFSGVVTADKPDFTDAKIDFSINVNSINTENEMRDTHLKSDDFFNAEKYPAITFKGKELIKTNGVKFQLKGDLTIRNITKPVILDVIYAGTVKDPWGNIKAGFKIKGIINRFDYGLKWNTLTEAGGATVGEDVEITVNLELSKDKK